MLSTKLNVSAHDGHVLIGLRGELDLVDSPYVAATLTAVADHDPWIVVDLTGLDYIDCSGVTALARGLRQARQARGDLLLAGARPQVTRLMTSIGLADDFARYATVAEAVGSIASVRPRLEA